MSETYTNNVGRSDYRLPTVSANDNGKILKVVEGEWKKAEDSGGSSDIPEYAEADAGKVLKVAEGGESLEWGESGGGGLTLYGPYFAKNNSQYSVGTSGEYIPLDKIYDSNDNEVSGNNSALYLMQSYNVSISGINTQSAGPYSVYVTSITGSSVTVGQFDCSVGFYSTVELQPAT